MSEQKKSTRVMKAVLILILGIAILTGVASGFLSGNSQEGSSSSHSSQIEYSTSGGSGGSSNESMF